MICSDAILAKFEFAFDLGDVDFKSYDLTKHIVSKGGAQIVPLLAIFRLKRCHQLVEHCVYIFFGREDARIPVRMHRGIIPCGNTFIFGVIGGGYIGVRAMKNCEAVRLLFKIAPMLVGFGHVAAKKGVVLRGMNRQWQMRGVGAFVRGRDQDGERVRIHERDGVRVVS